MNEIAKKPLPWWLPFVIGALLVAQFAGLGAWQISRGFEKRAQQELFTDDTGFSAWTDGMGIRPYQRLKASGRLDSEHQFLLDNIIINSRLGYYVLTPLEISDDQPLLIVNRGWLEKTSNDFESGRISIDAERVTVRGRAGSLPKAGYRMGDAIVPGSPWPQRAVYPNLDDLAAALGRELQPFVLLLDPQDDNGFVRHWVPEEMGAARHFAYALQWFAMAAVLAALLVWNFRRRRTRGA